jgi:hypothetical protein
LLLSELCWKFAREQNAQHVGDRLPSLESCDLDPTPHVGGDIDSQPGREVFGRFDALNLAIGGLYPTFWIAGSGRETAL